MASYRCLNCRKYCSFCDFSCEQLQTFLVQNKLLETFCTCGELYHTFSDEKKNQCLNDLISEYISIEEANAELEQFRDQEDEQFDQNNEIVGQKSDSNFHNHQSKKMRAARKRAAKALKKDAVKVYKTSQTKDRHSPRLSLKE